MWAATTGGGGGTPDTPYSGVQFYDNGSFGAESTLTFDKTGSGILYVDGTIHTKNSADRIEAGQDTLNTSLAIGSGAYTLSRKCVALGHNAKAGAAGGEGFAVALGTSTTALQGSVAIGMNTQDLGGNSVVIGKDAEAASDNCVAIGYDCEAKSLSVGVGANIRVHSAGATEGAIAIGAHSNIVGGTRSASSPWAPISIGYYSWAYGDSSIALGRY